MSVLLLDNYDSFTYNLFQMIQSVADEPVRVFRNDEIDVAEILEMKPSRIVISPGPGHPANASDFGVCRDVLNRRDELNCPVLGVCLGHQGIVQHLGGKVVQAPEIVHGKTSMIEQTAESPLFDGLPKTFEAMRYHSLIADEATLPAELEIIARDTGRGLVMGVQHREKPIFGVQFHPESIGTPEGATLLRNFAKCQYRPR